MKLVGLLRCTVPTCESLLVATLDVWATTRGICWDVESEAWSARLVDQKTASNRPLVPLAGCRRSQGLRFPPEAIVLAVR